MDATSGRRVAVVGGGLAGLAAALTLARRGCSVELFESRRQLGGRASSFDDPDTGLAVDHCQHVAMGCCDKFLDFCRDAEILHLFRRDRRLTFVGPDGRAVPFAPATWLPAPLHLAPAFLRLHYLTLREKLRIARNLRRLVAVRDPVQHNQVVREWLLAHGETERTLARFWGVVLVSALAEELGVVSVAAARQVFADGFLASRRACELFVPRLPLREIYTAVANRLRGLGVALHLQSRVERVAVANDAVHGIVLADQSLQPFADVIVAVPWRQVGDLFAEAARPPELVPATRLVASPITSLHLWFDRPITDLPHAVLVDRRSQWLFARPASDGSATSPAAYYQVVISASSGLAGRDRDAIKDEVVRELRAAFPRARQAQLVGWRILTDQHAVFSAAPGSDDCRPPQATSVHGLFLAGDWTRTGWPATMESAVRSGLLAAEQCLAQSSCGPVELNATTRSRTTGPAGM